MSGHLKRVLGKEEFLSLAIGAMIGWGWLTLSGQVIHEAGSVGALIALLLGAIGIGSVSLVYAELTSALPRSGGEIVFSLMGLGPRIACLCGWLLLLAYVSICALQAAAVSTLVSAMSFQAAPGGVFSYQPWDAQVLSVILGAIATLVIALICYRGIESAGLIQVSALILLFLIGIFFFLGAVLNAQSANLSPLWTGWDGLARALVLVPFFFLGFDVVAQVSEESKTPARSAGRLLMASVLVALAWQVMIHGSVALMVGRESMSQRPVAAVDAMSLAWQSPMAGRVLLAGGLLALLTTWNAVFLAAVRLVVAMSRAGMLPALLSRSRGRERRPAYAILFLSGVTLVALAAGKTALGWLLQAGSFGLVVTYLLVSLAFISLRRRSPEMERPYRVRFPRLIGSLAVGATLCLTLLHVPGAPVALGWGEWAILLVWTGLGAYLGRALLGELSESQRAAIRNRMVGDPAEGVRRMRETLQGLPRP